MSTCINGSSQSVSVFGQDDVDLEKACDEIFKQLQKTLNNCQCSIRDLTMVPDRDEDYIDACVIQLDLADYTEEFSSLMSELKKVGKQVLGSCPAACKEQYKTLVASRKIEKEEREKEKDADRKQRLGAVQE